MQKDFKPGDIIQYAGDTFKVLKNHGDSGRVQEYPNGDIIEPFYWWLDGFESVIIPSKEKLVAGCDSCPFWRSHFGFGHMICKITDKKIECEYPIPNWCPLKSGPISVRLKIKENP